MTELVRVDRTGPNGAVARVTLTRPDVHNAFNASLIADLRGAFVALAREGPTELRVVVLGGDGPTFCAGADVDWMRAALQLDVEGNEQDAMAMADMLEAIDTCPVPVIARVQGGALGGGAGLCAVADLVIAEAGAKFGFTETRLGILPAVISPFVVARIGETHARALFPGSTRSGPSGSGSSMRSWRGSREWMRPSIRPCRTSSPRARRRSGPPRQSFGRCAGSATARRSGTRRG